MRALLLFGIAFSSGICCILADNEEKKVHWSDISKNPFASIADSNSFNSADYDADYKEARYNATKQFLLKHGLLSKNTKPKEPYERHLHKLTNVYNRMKENKISNSIWKIILKIIGIVIVGLICWGLCALIKRFCRKRNQEVVCNADETFPALYPDPNTTGTQQYPQQPVPYPLQQMPNSSAPYVYSPLQQNPLNPSVPYPSAS